MSQILYVSESVESGVSLVRPKQRSQPSLVPPWTMDHSYLSPVLNAQADSAGK